jgi:hypothetical protein
MESGLRFFVRLLAVVAMLAGASTLILGADSIAGVSEASPSIDSEMRFYAAWYVGAGFLLFKTSAGPKQARSPVIRWVAGIFFLAGCARALSWITVGRPHTAAIALMFIELLLPAVLIPWERTAERRKETARD